MTETGSAPPSLRDGVEAILAARLARIVTAILNISIVLSLLVVIANVMVEKRLSQASVTLTAAVLGLGVLLLLVRRGHVREATLGLLGTFYIVVIGMILARGSVQIPSTSLVILAAALAGLVLGRRGLIIALAGGALIVGVLAVAEAHGMLREAQKIPLVTFWISMAAFSVTTGVIIAYGRSIAEDGLARARREVTEREVAEAQLRESQKLRALGTLAGGVAHDFNNIIAAILGNAELAREDARGNARALESLDEIAKAGRRGRDLVRQILSFSRRQPTELRAIALGPVVEESVRLLRVTLPPHVALETRVAPDVPAVLADANQIQQVVINLATNALQALRDRHGHIQVRLDAVQIDAESMAGSPALRKLRGRSPGRAVRLVVADDGPGMTAETLARIFEPFFTTKPVDEGTGLGLSVVHGIVDAHGGAIKVDSQPGRGATFAIYFPVAALAAVQDEQPAGERASSQPARDGARPAAASAGRILYLDDDESMVFLVTRLLERRGYRVSGHLLQADALAAVRADPFSFALAVSDYNMPGMSGLEVARALRKTQPGLPVVLASGFVDEALRVQAGEAGVRQVIFKAEAVEEFCDVVQRLVDEVGGTRMSPQAAAIE